MSTESTQSSSWGSWLCDLAVPPFAAGLGIVPAYHGFAVKTADQLGLPRPRVSFDTLKGGVGLAPTAAAVVGSQMIAQNGAEWAVKAVSGTGTEPATFSEKLASSAVVGCLSSPGIAVFNGRPAGQSAMTSMRKLVRDPKQALAISMQESGFVSGMSMAEPVHQVAKDYFGDNVFVTQGSRFVSGAFGALAGHPANTLLTRWQNGAQVELSRSLPRELCRGGFARATAVGVFSVGYNTAKEVVHSFTS